MQKNQKGFTLIELLVIICIIGLLATFAIINLDNARMKSRDAKRKADLRQIQKAISLFYEETGSYPRESSCNPDASNSNSTCSQISDWWDNNGLSSDLLGHNISEFIKLPVDPINDSTYYYQYEPDCTVGSTKQGYWLRDRLEETGSWLYVREGVQSSDPNCGNICDSGPPCW